MKKSRLIIAAIAAVMILTASIGFAMAYFSAYTMAAGAHTIHLRPTTDIEESFDSWTKHITVLNTGDAPCYVRAAIFVGGNYSCTCSGSGWTDGGDGYWYYSDFVPGGESTQVLEVKIDNIPQDVKEGDSFNVAVVYESCPVFYREDGTPYADWTAKLNTVVNDGGLD